MWRIVLVLLPPSEGKAVAPARGALLDVAELSFPQLTVVRATLLSAVTALCSGDPEVARRTLGLSVGLIAEVAKNRRILTTPTLPVSRLYTGVLYDALDLGTLEAKARQRARRSLVVFSALWGAVRMSDRVPPYRLAPNVMLPGLPSIGALWKTPLSPSVNAAAGRSLVLDLRSSAYAGMWRPMGSVADRTVTVGVLQERRPGDRSSRVVVSHFNKATKGLLVRRLLESGAQPRCPAELVAVIRDLGFTVESGPQPTSGKPQHIDLVVDDV